MDQKEKMWKLEVWDCRAAGFHTGQQSVGSRALGLGGSREWSRLTSH